MADHFSLNLIFAPYMMLAWFAMWIFCKKILIASKLLGDQKSNAVNMMFGFVILFGPMTLPLMPFLVIGYWIGYALGNSAEKESKPPHG